MRFDIRKGRGSCISAAVFACGLAMTAQQAAATDEQAAGEEGQRVRLETVTVTAQRRPESLQDVAVMVTVFDAQEVEDARIRQIDDIVTRTPGLSFDAFPASQARLYIRGIGSSERGAGGDPSSAVFLDEIYLGRPAAVAFDAFDVERIEVLKGPQGTLFGRNVVGGAINVISKRPRLDGFDASASTTMGNYARRDGTGFANIPITNHTSAIRVSASYTSHDGFVENPFLNDDVEDQERSSARLQYYAEPTDPLRILFTLDGTRDRATGSANHVLELDTSNPLSSFYSQNFDPDLTFGSDPGYQNRDTWGVRGEVSYDFDFGTLTALASHRDLDYEFRYDFDGGNPDPASPGFNAIDISGGNDEQAEMSSQEIRLSSLPGRYVEWVAGAYRYEQDVARSDILLLDAAVIAPIALYEAFIADASLESFAVFGDASVPVSERWAVFGGLRYSRDDKRQRVFNTDSDTPLRADEFYDVTASAKFDDWTYRAGAEFLATPNTMLYATISRGFKSGGFNDTASSALEAATPVEPETAIQYEIGQKSTLLDGTMIWNNTFYYMDYSDLQTNKVIDGRSVTNNAGKAHIQGYETQLLVRPFNDFELALAYAFTDAIFDEFEEDGTDFSGNRISRTPRHKVTVSPSYVLPLANGADLSFAVDYRYASKIFDSNNNLPPEFRGPTHFVDARVVMGHLIGGLSLSLWGKNLTDERTRTFQGGFLGATFGAFSPPRTYGVTLNWDY